MPNAITGGRRILDDGKLRVTERGERLLLPFILVA